MLSHIIIALIQIKLNEYLNFFYFFLNVHSFFVFILKSHLEFYKKDEYILKFMEISFGIIQNSCSCDFFG